MTAHAYFNLFAPDSEGSAAPLGQPINVKGAEWIRIKAGANIAAFQPCIVNSAGIAVPLTTTNAGADPQDVVIPQFAFAEGESGYAPVGPFGLREDGVTPFRVAALTLCAQDVKLYTTATAGAVDDTATTLITGLSLTETNAGGNTANMPCVAVSRLGVNKS